MVRVHVWVESLLGQPAVGHGGITWCRIELHTNKLPAEHTSQWLGHQVLLVVLMFSCDRYKKRPS